MNPMTPFALVTPRTKFPFLILAVFTALADAPVEGSIGDGSRLLLRT